VKRAEINLTTHSALRMDYPLGSSCRDRRSPSVGIKAKTSILNLSPKRKNDSLFIVNRCFVIRLLSDIWRESSGSFSKRSGRNHDHALRHAL